ncbi:hypothetical protein B0H17DRAFT_1206975 [Mycena rosella]|uniref:Uncharacterized protein n=1 Tax=Mycena rosella TaxID=1033263 RepID=A0AAD7D3X1_MYCRO|nr:hypothetical protein B0H17DRAFT_1206975 [Mycena rosella]
MVPHLKSQGVSMDLASIWGLGFEPNAYMIGYPLWNNKNVLASFITYLFYNNILTRQLAADEWVRFMRSGGKKPLPAGMQRSSYFLSLPMRYGAPTSSFGSGPDGARLPEFEVSAKSYSALGVILARRGFRLSSAEAL